MTTSGWGTVTWTRVAIGLAIAIVGIAGCASVLGIDSDRHVVEGPPDTGTPVVDAGPPDTGPPADAGSGLDAAAIPTNWSCLADPEPTIPTGDLQLDIFFNDVGGNSSSSTTTGTPVPDMLVHYCNKLDINCGNPSTDVLTDDGGVAHLIVPGGFDGYYEGISDAGYTPAILSRTPQISNEYSTQGVANIGLLTAGAGLAGVGQQPDLSIAIVTAADCTTTPAAGISFTVAAQAQGEEVVYLVNNLPTKGATQTDSQSGSALIFNVPPGTLTVSAAFADTGIPIRTVTTLGRQGWVTFIQIRPDQASHSPIP